MNFNQQSIGYFTAMTIGFLIGIVRERLHHPGAMMAGVRTHTIASMTGAVALSLGMPAFLVCFALIGSLIAVGYYRSFRLDPGMTGEVSLLMTVLLGGLAMMDSELAAALGVGIACLLFLKKPLRKLSQELLSEKELEDALILFASALIVLPLMPNQTLDTWNSLNPFAIWKVVVIIMFAGMVGHLAVRLTGLSWGLPIAGFFSGFISSTAVIMDLGRRAKNNPEITDITCASALLSNLASLILFSVVLGSSSPPLLLNVLKPLLFGGLVLFAFAMFYLRHHQQIQEFKIPIAEGAFKLQHVFYIAFTISCVSVISTGMGVWFGQPGNLLAAVIVGFAEIHAAAMSIAQLNQPLVSTGFTTEKHIEWAVIAILGASVISKSVLSFLNGGKIYGKKISTALISFVLASCLGLLI